MKMDEEPKRAYTKRARARSEAATGEAILDAARDAFFREPFDRVTLQGIADRSGVTIQTVIRRFGSKERLFENVGEREEARVRSDRTPPAKGGLSAALEALIDHYETDGDVVLNFLAQEHQFEHVGRIVRNGRDIHREWVERYCSDILGGRDRPGYREALHAAIAATDLYTWKLLCRDLGLDRTEVRNVMTVLLDGLRS